MAKLFRAAAEAETIHAHAHLRVMNGIKDTVSNLKEAIEVKVTNFRKCIRSFLLKHKKRE